jgi:hypothetical protein
VLSLVVLASVFSGVVPAQAQTAINYAEYVNLFKGTNPPASLTPYSLFKTENGTTTPDVKFNLQMSFAGISRDNAGDDKEAAWAKIRDFNDSAYVFLLRICDVNDPTETRCLFARIPHKRVPLSPPPTNQQTPEIYHYQYTNVFSSDLQNDKFNVLFPVTALIGVNPQGLIVQNPVSDFVFIGNTTTYKADAWYCAQGNNIPTQNDPSNPNYRMFNDICGNGKPYFKIATSATFRMPQSAAEAQSQVPGTITPVDTTPTQSNVPSCGFIDGSILGCIAQVAYYLIYRPIAWFAGLMGNLFDFFLGYSLSDASYRAEFAVRGWQIVRDICNIFFVIILVWVGIMTVFKTSSYNPKKVLATLVINALLINFSLFVTRVVIDVSNITARVFYHSVEVCDGPCQKDAQGVIQNTKPGIGGYTPLSEKIVSAFNPQKIFSMNVLSASSMLPDNGTTAQGGAKTLSVGDSEYAGYYLVVSLIAAFILFAIAMMFWKTAFFFLGRVIGLYIAMIFSPFAFLARDGVPIVGSIKKLSWNTWLGDLIKYATLAPIFVFFLYVIYSFLETDFLKVYQEKIGTNFFETVVYIAIPMLIVYFMINQGVKIAEEYAGDFGKQVQGLAMKTLGAGVGVAAGGAAFAGRNVLGRGLRLFGNSGIKTVNGADGKPVTTTRAERWAANANNSWLNRQWNNTYSKTQTGTWDARNLGAKIGGKEYKAGDTLFKGFGLSDSVSKSVGLGQDKLLGKDGKPGGIIAANKKRADNRQKDLENRIDMSHLSDDEAKNAAAKYKSDRIKKYTENNWEDHIADDPKMKIVNDALKKAKEEKEKAEKDLENIQKTGTTYEINIAQNKLDTAKKNLVNQEKYFNAAKTQLVNDIKNGTHSKDDILKAAQKKKEEDLSAYKVKDAASFTNMMRAEYVNDLQNSSFMRKVLEGVNFTDGLAGIAGAVIAGTIPMLAPAIVAAMSGAVAMNFTDSAIDAATDSTAKAIKAINKKAKSKTGTGNVLIDMEARLETLKAIVEKTTGKPYDKASEDDILNHIADLEGKRDDLSEDLKPANRGAFTQDKLQDKRRERARINDELEKLKNIQDKIARQQKDIDEYKQKEKDKEANKKEKESKDK